MGNKQVIVGIFDAAGGPEKPEQAADGFVAGPTDPGEFVMAYCGKHSSARYPDWSKIRWGSKLKDEGGEIWVQHEGTWRKLSELTRVTRDDILEMHDVLYGVRAVPDTWVFNDFGHQTCYYYKDKNKDRKLSKGEKIHGEFFHTTPLNEAQTKRAEKDPSFQVTLEESHGCIHVKPADMDVLIKKRYFATGNRIVIHSYSSEPLPGSVKAGVPPYQVHFYPGIQKLYVLGAPKPK